MVMQDPLHAGPGCAASERIVAPTTPLGVAVAHALHNGAATAAALRERTLRVPTSRQATIHEVAWRT